MQDEMEDSKVKDEEGEEEKDALMKDAALESNDDKMDAKQDAFEMRDAILSSDDLDTIVSSLTDVFQIFENAQDLIVSAPIIL